MKESTDQERQTGGEQLGQERKGKGEDRTKDQTGKAQEQTAKTPAPSPELQGPETQAEGPEEPPEPFLGTALEPQAKSETGKPESQEQQEQGQKPGTWHVERPMDTRSTEGVTRLEQIDRGTIPDQRLQEPSEPSFASLDQASQRPGAGIPDELAQQWMNRVEADPGRVLRRQFEVEERREWEHSAGRLVETRPW
jgi:hypothetical protein